MNKNMETKGTLFKILCTKGNMNFRQWSLHVSQNFWKTSLTLLIQKYLRPQTPFQNHPWSSWYVYRAMGNEWTKKMSKKEEIDGLWVTKKQNGQ